MGFVGESNKQDDYACRRPSANVSDAGSIPAISTGPPPKGQPQTLDGPTVHPLSGRRPFYDQKAETNPRERKEPQRIGENTRLSFAFLATLR